MQCDKCRRDAVIFQRYSGLQLCGEHFIADFESKAKREIRSGGGLRRGDHIAIAGSGGHKSCALMYFLAMLTKKRRDITLSVIWIDDETSGDCRAGGEDIAASLGIAGIPASEDREKSIPACPVPGGTERAGSGRDLLWEMSAGRIARAHGATKIFCGTGLDDEALSVLTAILEGEPLRLLHPERENERLPRIRPFLHIPDREIALYARLTLGLPETGAGRHPRTPFLKNAKKMLDDHTERHPSAPHALVNLGERLAGAGIPAGMGDPRGNPAEDGSGRVRRAHRNA